MQLLWSIQGDGLAALRDRALIAFGMVLAARRSELVALAVADLAWEGKGLRVTIRPSKTDQEGTGAVVVVQDGRRLTPLHPSARLAGRRRHHRGARVPAAVERRARAPCPAVRPSDVFFDSNVLLYTLVAGDPRAAVASNLLAAGGTISVHVLNEIANVARRRKFKLPWAEVDVALAALRVLCAAPVPLTLATNTAALALAERHQFLFYDALIVASALEAGCTTLLSEDLHHGLP